MTYWAVKFTTFINSVSFQEQEVVQGASSEGDERWSHFRNILKIELTGFADGLSISYKRKRKVKDNSNILDSATQRIGFHLLRWGRLWEEQHTVGSAWF